MMKKRFIISMVLIGIAVLCASAQCRAQEGLDEQPLTQEEFAVELVKTMRMDAWLPTTALPSDCVDLLRRMGVSPLTGWNNKALMTKEDYLVVVAQVNGKESVVHERARAVEDKNREVIDQKWQQSYTETSRWMPLEELLANKKYFPQGPPKSPYGFTYQDRNNDYQLDPPPYSLPVALVVLLRELFLSQ